MGYNVTQGPVLNPSGSSATLTPGNSITLAAQGNNVFSLPALGTIQPFSAVLIGVNGCSVADPTVGNFLPAYVLGIALGSYAAGATAQVASSGLVTNTLTGVGGWNFVIGQPVYVGASGVLTQTLPSVGFALPIGYAVSASTLCLTSAAEMQNTATTLSLSAAASTVTVNPNLYQTGGRVALTQSSTQITLQAGLYNGQEFQLEVVQSSSGNNAYQFVGAKAGTFVASTTANASDLFIFHWLASKNEWVVTGSALGI